MISRFIEYLRKEKRFSEKTLEAYNRDLRQFYSFVAVPEHKIILETKKIRQWIGFLSQQGLSNKTISRKLSSLKSFYKFLLKSNLIEENPTDKIPSIKIEKKLPEFVPEEHIKHLEDDFFEDNFKGLRALLTFEILYQTGIRRSELINLRDIDIDFSAKNIKVIGKGNKERLIPISDKLLNLIKKYLELKNEKFMTPYLIITDKGKQAYEKLIYRIVNQVLNYITTVRQKSPHTLRHTFATHLLNHGSDIRIIKELLGHSNIQTTQKYTHTSLKQLNKIYKLAHPRA